MAVEITGFAGFMGEILRVVLASVAEVGGRRLKEWCISVKAIAFTPTHSATKTANPKNFSQRGNRWSSFMRKGG